MPREEKSVAPPPLKERLRDPDPRTRLGALGALLKPGADAEPYRRDVADRLVDESEPNRRLAVLVLGTLGAAEELGLALDDRQPLAIRLAVASTLAQLGPRAEAALGPLIRSLESRADQLRFLSSVALGKMGKPAVAPLLRVLSDPEPLVVCAAVDALGFIGKDAKDAVAGIERLAGRAGARVVLACAAALIRITGDAAAGLTSLTSSLEHGDAETRAESVERLSRLRADGRGAEAALLRRTKDQAPKVRAKAAVALAATGVEPSRTVEAVTPLLADVDPDVRMHAAASLSHLGPRAKGALPALRRAAEDPVPSVAATARAAVRRVEGAGTEDGRGAA